MRNISDFNFKIRALQFVNHLLVVAGFISLFYGIIGINYLYIGAVAYVWLAVDTDVEKSLTV